MSNPIYDSNTPYSLICGWCKLSSDTSTFTLEGDWIFENNNRNPKSKWNNKYPELFDFEWDDNGLLNKFSCDGDKTYTFDLYNTENKKIEDFVYIKSVTSRKYYLKISKSDLVDFKQMFSKFWCN